uniref:Large ribosomal subunit protein uL22c n=1 Tax=Trigastrotheca stricta TaxID=437579 RepID=A0A411K0E4_9CARY|nr:ribosomal protein L22 [Trigastrotheca stricta]QBC70729.1 ribosomal protein L22 [Trigastrotheca stricta]
MLNNLKNRKRDRHEVYTASQLTNYGEVYAVGQYISMSADKARRVIDQIRGRSYEETLMILELMPFRACYPIFKLIYSAAANASHNKGFNKEDLIISKAEVNKGTTRKKLKPRARGRSYLIKRPTCHITIVVQDISYMEDWRRKMQRLSVKDRQALMAVMTTRRLTVPTPENEDEE